MARHSSSRPWPGGRFRRLFGATTSRRMATPAIDDGISPSPGRTIIEALRHGQRSGPGPPAFRADAALESLRGALRTETLMHVAQLGAASRTPPSSPRIATSSRAASAMWTCTVGLAPGRRPRLHQGGRRYWRCPRGRGCLSIRARLAGPSCGAWWRSSSFAAASLRLPRGETRWPPYTCRWPGESSPCACGDAMLALRSARALANQR